MLCWNRRLVKVICAVLMTAYLACGEVSEAFKTEPVKGDVLVIDGISQPAALPSPMLNSPVAPEPSAAPKPTPVPAASPTPAPTQPPSPVVEPPKPEPPQPAAEPIGPPQPTDPGVPASEPPAEEVPEDPEALAGKAGSAPENFMPSRQTWKIIAPITYQFAKADAPQEPHGLFVADGGQVYAPLHKTLADMGYIVTTYQNADAKNKTVRWHDSDLGDYWVNTETHLIHGPEFLSLLSWVYKVGDEIYIPLRSLAEACYWTYAEDMEAGTARIERLMPSRFLVDKTMQLTTMYGLDGNGDEKAMRTFLTTTGAAFSATPSHTYSVRPLPLNSQHKYYFPTVKVYIKYCSQLVGDVCIHTPYSNRANVINTPEMARGYKALGKRASDGCIRYLFNDAKFIYCMGKGLPFKIVDGGQSDEAQSVKDRLLLELPPFGDWIAQMEMYE